MNQQPTFSSEQIDYFMQVALNEAKLAETDGEVPIGAVIVKDNVIIARAPTFRVPTLKPPLQKLHRLQSART